MKNPKGNLVGKIQRTVAVKGLGGFGFKGTGAMVKIPARPKRETDLVLDAQSFPGQAFWYRLSGDTNPLHVNPLASSVQKF